MILVAYFNVKKIIQIASLFFLINICFPIYSQFTEHDIELSMGMSVYPGLNNFLEYKRHLNDNVNFNIQGKGVIAGNLYATVGLTNFTLKRHVERQQVTRIPLYSDTKISSGFRFGFEQQFEADVLGFYHGISYLYMRDRFIHKEYYTYRELSTDYINRYKGVGYTLGITFRFAYDFLLAFQIEPSFFNVRYSETVTAYGMTEKHSFEETYFTMNNNLMILLMLRL